jgi:hypothetical protein
VHRNETHATNINVSQREKLLFGLEILKKNYKIYKTCPVHLALFSPSVQLPYVLLGAEALVWSFSSPVSVTKVPTVRVV